MTGETDIPPLTAAEQSPWHALDLAVARDAVTRAAVVRRDDKVPRVDPDAIVRAAVDALVLGVRGAAVEQLAGMDGRSWSEIDVTLDRIYPAERGTERPEDGIAVGLLGDRILRDSLGMVAPREAARRLYRLWALTGYEDDRLQGLSCLDDTYSLVDSGVLQQTASDVDTELRAEAARILSAGGLVAA